MYFAAFTDHENLQAHVFNVQNFHAIIYIDEPIIYICCWYLYADDDNATCLLLRTWHSDRDMLHVCNHDLQHAYTGAGCSQEKLLSVAEVAGWWRESRELSGLLSETHNPVNSKYSIYDLILKFHCILAIQFMSHAFSANSVIILLDVDLLWNH